MSEGEIIKQQARRIAELEAENSQLCKAALRNLELRLGLQRTLDKFAEPAREKEVMRT